jgi:hypothetical protein
MTRLIIVLASIAAVGGLLYFRAQQREQLKRIQAAEAAAREASGRVVDSDERSDKFKREMLKLQAEELMRPRATASSNSPGESKPEHPATKLFRDPEMRATMRREHLSGMNQRVRSIVDSNLTASLNLTPEQATALEELVRKKHTPSVDFLMALMSSDGDELPGIARAAQSEWSLADAEIKSFLGEQAYATYKTYEDSLAEREQLSRLRRDFEKTGLTLSPELEASLLQAMVEERQNFRFTHNFHDQMNFDMDRLPEIFAEENLNRFMDETAQLNERIIARAQGFMGVQEGAEFAQALRNQFERSKMTIKMTATLFPVGRRN